MNTMLFFGAIALIAFFWALPSLFQINKFEDEMDSWDAIDYRFQMNAQGPNSGPQQNPMFWGQMFHPYEVMKQAYEIEERRRSSNIKQTVYLILLIIVSVVATYLLKGLGLI